MGLESEDAVLRNLWLTYNPQHMIQQEPQKDWSNSKRSVNYPTYPYRLCASITTFYTTYCVPLSWCWEQAQPAVEWGVCFTFRGNKQTTKKKTVVLSCPICWDQWTSCRCQAHHLGIPEKPFDILGLKMLWQSEVVACCKYTTLPVLPRHIPLGEGWRWFVEAFHGSLSCHSLCSARFLR